jgi:hypothetical protein
LRGETLPKTDFKTVFVFLDTDKHASAFDMLTLIDVFPEATVLTYENVTAEDADKIIHDAMFPRGPEGAKHTKIFINGHDFEGANQILEKIKKSMFTPFELAVIIDPRGAYTTAAAAVAKTLELFALRGLGSAKNKTVAVLAGTGPVGQTAAKLYATENLNVIVTSRTLQKASSFATMVNEELKNDRIRGVEAQTNEEIGKAIEEADIVLSAGAAGMQILPLEVLRAYGENCRVIADINAIPPLGVEGLDADMNGKEMLAHVFGIGALTIGKLKNKIEIELIKKASEQSNGIFDYRVAYEIAKQIIFQKHEEREKTEAEPQKHWLP